MNDADSGPPMSSYGQRLEASESTQSLLSRRGSEFGNRYVQIDDAGIYLSSLAVTILLSSVATIGILLFTLVVTLSVMLGSCQSQPMLLHGSWGEMIRAPPCRQEEARGNPCESFRLNAEMNNLQGWLLPRECSSYVGNYMVNGQYLLDVEAAVGAARSYLEAIAPGGDGLDAIVLDIDDTVLSNVPYYTEHQFGVEQYNVTAWNEWVEQARAPPLRSMLSLYRQMVDANWSMIFITGRPEQQRNKTAENLFKAGFSDWMSLNLRFQNEVGTTAVNYKSSRRMHLERKGYRIRASIGDQWSDLIGPAAGNRTFKLPNPMYYIF
ncbi:hypothetical protein SELMODRAFT_139413 [Selaginella moellendorffii]|uniref:Acid phosphatase n=1 Tax=Selaginella moellendorffii TaxID=88036 RepID=D8QQ46_SELML|nr:hypothetical protein SELMODRAFT_139413 [Selaginella moellendorffii]